MVGMGRLAGGPCRPVRVTGLRNRDARCTERGTRPAQHGYAEPVRARITGVVAWRAKAEMDGERGECDQQRHRPQRTSDSQHT
jgi:hypothetical protein